ncbi:MAG: hypothetical protein ABR521_10225 [Gaiellaceae bacterium]
MSMQADQGSADRLLGEISALVARRQALRSAGASSTALERNRLRIARLQWRLSHALIERFLPAQHARAA